MIQQQLGLLPSTVNKETKGEYGQTLIDSRKNDGTTIIHDVMLAQHIANMERSILQYQNSVNNTVTSEKTTSRLISAIKNHQEYTHE